MASVATSNITRLDRVIGNNLATALTLPGGVAIGIYRIASGQAPGDTAVIPLTPEMATITSVLGPVQHNLSGTGATQATVTLTGNGSTVTVAAVDIMIFGTARTS